MTYTKPYSPPEPESDSKSWWLALFPPANCEAQCQALRWHPKSASFTHFLLCGLPITFFFVSNKQFCSWASHMLIFIFKNFFVLLQFWQLHFQKKKKEKKKNDKATTSLVIHASRTTVILLGLLGASKTSRWGRGRTPPFWVWKMLYQIKPWLWGQIYNPGSE